MRSTDRQQDQRAGSGATARASRWIVDHPLRVLLAWIAVAGARVSRDGRTLQFPVVLDADPTSERALDLAGGRLREIVGGAVPGARTFVTGESAAYADVRSAINRDYTVVFPVAAGLLIAAFPMACLLVPATLTVFGRRSWWPGDPSSSRSGGRGA